MAKKNFIPQKLCPWIEARKKYRLSHAQVQMARELGMNPRKFASLANHHQEPWKLPLPQFIEHCYEKRFGKKSPDDIRSIEAKLVPLRRSSWKKQKRNKNRRWFRQLVKFPPYAHNKPMQLTCYSSFQSMRGTLRAYSKGRIFAAARHKQVSSVH